MNLNARIRRLIDGVPEGASVTLPVPLLQRWLDQAEEDGSRSLSKPPSSGDRSPEEGWETKLWRVPSRTRLGAKDVAEAVERSVNWVHQRTQASADVPIPHRKRNGRLVFLAGEVREWLDEQEEVIVPGSSTANATERRDFEVVGENDRG